MTISLGNPFRSCLSDALCLWLEPRRQFGRHRTQKSSPQPRRHICQAISDVLLRRDIEDKSKFLERPAALNLAWYLRLTRGGDGERNDAIPALGLGDEEKAQCKRHQVKHGLPNVTGETYNGPD
jgi:hypothetical protein